MGPYSHLIIAECLAAELHPEDLPSYYWGAAAPDTRYLVPGMHRNRTHIPLEDLLDYAQTYPHLQDFILGYRVHLCSDLLDLPGYLQRKLPFILTRRRLPTHIASTLVEFYNLTRPFPHPPPVSGKHNPLLADLGISAPVAQLFSVNLRAYLANPSYQAVLDIFTPAGIETNPRVAQYQDAACEFDRSRLFKRLVFWGLRVGHINSEILRGVRSIWGGQADTRMEPLEM